MKLIVKKPNFVTPPGTIFDVSEIFDIQNQTHIDNLIFCVKNGTLEVLEGSLDSFLPNIEEEKKITKIVETAILKK